MGWLRDDVTAILAITYGTAISAGVTGAFLSRGHADHAHVHMEAPSVAVKRAAPRIIITTSPTVQSQRWFSRTSRCWATTAAS
jgi:hypothetical protein